MNRSLLLNKRLWMISGVLAVLKALFASMSHPQTMGRRRAALAIALLASAFAAASPAAALAPDFRDFALSKTTLDLQGRVNALDKRLNKSGVKRLLAETNRDAVHNGARPAPSTTYRPAASGTASSRTTRARRRTAR